MLKQEIMSVHAALGGVLNKLDPDGAALVRQCRRNLDAAAEQAGELEERLVPLSGPERNAIRKMDRPGLAGKIGRG